MNDALERRDPFAVLGALSVEGKLTSTGLLLDDPELPFGRYEEIGRQFGLLYNLTRFAIGDLIAFGEDVYGEGAYQVDEALGLSPKTLLNYASVSRAIAHRNRVEGLSWSHHREVVKLPPCEQRGWLERAHAGDWTVGRLRAKLADVGLPHVGKLDPGPESLTTPENTEPTDPDPTSTSTPEDRETAAGAAGDDLVRAARDLVYYVGPKPRRRRQYRFYEVPATYVDRLRAALDEGGQLPIIEVTPDPKRRGEPES
jgi:hypothetical protein